MTDLKNNELKGIDTKILADEAVMVLCEKQGIDIKLFDVRENATITDFYVNCTGKSLSHVASLADDLCDNFEERGRSPLRIEGKRGNSWILVDFGDVIVNIFDSEARGFYNLDKHLPPEALRPIDELIKRVDEKLGFI